jgi:signal transduction histidine kinase
VAQEALTNALKHAPGTAGAHVRLTYRPGEVELEVTDDGPVTPERAGRPGGGHGIAGMRERAAMFGGQVSAGPHPGGGWRVRAVLPVASALTPADSA